jgi:NADH-dependent peroxiredoxin subunit F
MYDLAIIGGGPAGTAAGVYASRKRLKTLFLTEDFGGQSKESPDIQNWIGSVNISGRDLARSFEAHLKAYADDVLDIHTGQKVTSVKKEGDYFQILTDDNKIYQARTVLLTVGSLRRKLDVPGADIFENKGITYCASCDGPMFREKNVIVIGGGNAGFETASQLLAYAKKVTLLHVKSAFKADPVTVEKVISNPKMTALSNARTVEIKGDVFVKSLVYENTATGEQHEIEADGVFVEIGLIPSTKFIENFVEVNEYKQIITDPRSQRTSVPGVWAAGDCTDGLYHQNNIAAGDAVKALEDIYLYLHTGRGATSESKTTKEKTSKENSF